MKVFKTNKPSFKFMAMSKLIGLIAFLLILAITGFAMFEMHITNMYDALPQLIISIFAFASIYAGFYLTMAKMEHIEAEKTKREIELNKLKRGGATEEELAEKRQQISELLSKANEILGEENKTLM